MNEHENRVPETFVFVIFVSRSRVPNSHGATLRPFICKNAFNFSVSQAKTCRIVHLVSSCLSTVDFQLKLIVRRINLSTASGESFRLFEDHRQAAKRNIRPVFAAGKDRGDLRV